MTPPNGNGSTAVPARGGISLSLVWAIASLGAIQMGAVCFQLLRSKVVAITLGTTASLEIWIDRRP